MIPNTIFIASVLLLSSLPISSTSTSVPNDDIAIIRQRVLELAIWPPEANISDAVQNALNYNATLNSSCYWPDINYHDQAIIVWLTSFHMR